MHARHPQLTFYCTTKVEHILEHPEALPDLADGGCAFVVSAFESVNDTTLAALDKGHTAAEASAAIALLRGHGIEVRPSWLPFTPWTTIEDLVALADFVLDHDLVPNVDPVQFTVRLLVPEGSLLLNRSDMTPHLGPYDADRLGWTWVHPDPSIDLLQQELAALVEERVERDGAETFGAIDALIRSRSAHPSVRPSPAGAVSTGPRPEQRARLTEPWFCCSEPTAAQLAPLAPLG
jgi:hypothetical protein